MDPEVVFASEHAQVDIDRQRQLVRLTWNGNAAGSAYREPSLAVLKAVQDFRLKYFLSDARKMGPILFADRSWSEKEVIPKFIEAGLVRIAILSSTDGLNLIAVDNMVNTIPMGTMTVGFFDDVTKAQQWLLNSDDAAPPVRVNGTQGRKE